MEPVLSIIMPVYNVERYLAACLESALAQDIPGLEIICVNDGSTDSSPEILEQFAAQDSRIRVIDKENAGYGAAMNDGLRAARGTYVGILESDDRVCDGAWQALLDLAQANDLDMVRGSYYRVRNGVNEYYNPHTGAEKFGSPLLAPLPLDQVIDTGNYPLCHWVTPSLWAGLYRRSFLLDEDIWFLETPGASYQDTAFTFKTWTFARRVMLTDIPVIYYTLDNETSSTNSKSKVFAICDEAAECDRFLIERNLKDKYGSGVATVRCRTYSWNVQRVSPEFKHAFEEVMWKEYADDFRAGFCTPAVFKQNDLQLMARKAEGRPAVSILFAADPATGNLEAALKRLTELETSDVEVLCLPIGEAPATIAMLSTAAEADSRFRVLEPEPTAAEAYSTAMAEAQGTYLLFADSSDRVKPELLDKAAERADRSALDAVVCAWQRKIPHLPALTGNPLLAWPKPRTQCSADDVRGFVLRFDTELLANKLFRASFLEDAQLSFAPSDNAIADFARSSLSLAPRIMTFKENLATHVTKNSFGPTPEELLDIAQQVEDRIKQEPTPTLQTDFKTWKSTLYAYGMKVRTLELQKAEATLEKTREDLRRKEEECAHAQRTVKTLRASRSFKAGHTLTAPARAAKRALRRFKK